MVSPSPAYIEVTDTVSVPYVTGIQRTVRRLLASWPADAAVTPVPVVHNGTHFRRLVDEEEQQLWGSPTGPPGSLEGGLRSLVKRIPGAKASREVAMATARRRRERSRDALRVDLAAGDLFFDMEASWWSPAPRAELLPALRAGGVRVASLVYDLMPLRNPEWFDPENLAAFEPWARAQLRHSELAVVFSQFCADEVAHFGAPDPPPTARFVPGADPVEATPRRPVGVPDDGVPFVLCVGTIEPRKNVSTLLDALDRLWADGERIRLVLVGRRGWHVDDLVARMRRHPRRDDLLVWNGWASDGEVDWLYRHATVVAVPSWCEGYGLPVVEAHRRGSRVLSSTGGALAEIGGSTTTYVDPGDAGAWAEGLRAAVAAGRPSRAELPAAAEATWADAATTVAAHLAEFIGRPSGS